MTESELDKRTILKMMYRRAAVRIRTYRATGMTEQMAYDLVSDLASILYPHLSTEHRIEMCAAIQHEALAELKSATIN